MQFKLTRAAVDKDMKSTTKGYDADKIPLEAEYSPKPQQDALVMNPD